MARRNPVARDLRTPRYRKRVVRDKTRYSRKGRQARVDAARESR
jgi:hypothetical protein